MLSAKPIERMDGCVTLARIVFVGPVLKNRQKHVRNINGQIHGNGECSTARRIGKPTSMAAPETRKYEPEKRALNLSPQIPPSSVPVRPATAVIPPKITVEFAGAPGRPSR